MTRPAAAAGGSADARNSRVDRWISHTAAATVAGLAGIAGAVSYSHMRQLAQDHGQAGWHAHAFPLSVDGIEIVASLVLLADRRVGRRSGWLPWAALAVGTAGSLAANVATAGPGTISRIIAGWPALALLIAVKLLSGMLDRDPARRPASVPGTQPFRSSGPDTCTANDTAPPHAVPIPSQPVSARRRPGTWQSARSHQVSPTGDSTCPATWNGTPTSQATSDPLPLSEPGAVAALLPAARAARDGLYRDGHPLTRDALAAHLRQNGHPVRNIASPSK